jgi:methyl-accepting chemotaxis protein
MAQSIDQVSANAAESSAVAERSVAIANKGNEVVHNTIHGMDNIRDQIQDTAKRIKRLGESSQEIGDIVSLIDDIADQTNILALNAAIQASMAGDAGRGFAVVADEVQRLAERSSAATRQIENLVRAIQADTNEAVISMEQTTTEVVRGARLAQDAGVALEEIEGVSQDPGRADPEHLQRGAAANHVGGADLPDHERDPADHQPDLVRLHGHRRKHWQPGQNGQPVAPLGVRLHLAARAQDR